MERARLHAVQETEPFQEILDLDFRDPVRVCPPNLKLSYMSECLRAFYDVTSAC